MRRWSDRQSRRANNMETLLKPGDMIRIRDDIRESRTYTMWIDKEVGNSWIADDMLPAGTLVEIVNIVDGQYVVRSISLKRDQRLYDDEFWLYTDQMFDPVSITYLIEEMVEEDYF